MYANSDLHLYTGASARTPLAVSSLFSLAHSLRALASLASSASLEVLFNSQLQVTNPKPYKSAATPAAASQAAAGNSSKTRL